MPPILALFLTTSFVVWLFLRDEGRGVKGSWALWLPVAWLAITGTRFVSQWLALGQWAGPGTSEDGSALDAFVFGLLTLAGFAVLLQRRVMLADLARQNPWIVALLAYGLISVVWSDFPFVSFKRWIKSLGNPVMALVVLTDPDPVRAFRTLMRRFAFLTLPFSVMLIKYYPEYGRGFDGWTGEAFNHGVGLNKNGLGLICMVVGLALTWEAIIQRKVGRNELPVDRRMTIWLLLGMTIWLLVESDSKTAMVCLFLGIATLVTLRNAPRIRARIGVWVIAAAVLGVLVEGLFDPYAAIIRALGRDPTLTDRTAIWADVIALQPNMWLGAGYEAFWLGERLLRLWSKWHWQPNQAHSGYIEMYINGGIIGVVLMVGMLISAFRHASAQLRQDDMRQVDWAALRMAFLVVILVYNYTEATFKGVNVVWTIFYLIAWQVAVRASAVRRHGLQVGHPNAMQRQAQQRTPGHRAGASKSGDYSAHGRGKA